MKKEYYMDITMEQFKKELKFMDYEELKKLKIFLTGAYQKNMRRKKYLKD